MASRKMGGGELVKMRKYVMSHFQCEGNFSSEVEEVKHEIC